MDLTISVWMKILNEIYLSKIKQEKTFAAKISHDLFITYSHVTKVLRFLQSVGFINIEIDKDRKTRKLITLTEKGKDLSLAIYLMFILLEKGVKN